MKTKYKHIHFVKKTTAKSEVWWECCNNKTDAALGYIDLYPSWKQWVFSAADIDCVFSVSCLQDIIHFIGQLQ